MQPIDKHMLAILSIVQKSSVLAPFGLFVIPFTITSDPLYFLLDNLVHIFIFKERNILSVLLEKFTRGAILVVFGIHLILDLYQILTCLLIVLNVALKLFSATFIRQKVLSSVNRKQCLHRAWLITEEFTRGLSFKFSYKMYRQIQFISILHDEISHVSYPVVFGMAYSGLVMCVFIVFAGYEFVPWNVYLMMCGTTFLIGVVLVVLFQRFCDFDRCSQEFRDFWKARLHTRLHRKHFNSLRPVRIGVHPFFYFRTKFFLNLMWNMLSFIVTFFLTFKNDFD